MVDRERRDIVAAALRAYMAEDIGAFEFDRRIFKVHDGPTKDQTVVQVVVELWGCYDDLQDHRIVATKRQWDYFNRLLLVLESEAELERVTGARRWGPIQAVATLCLAVFAFGFAVTGYRWALLWWTVPLGFVSIVLARLGRVDLSPDEAAKYPFESVGALMSMRRTMPRFTRRRYPEGLRRRSIRGAAGEFAMWAPRVLYWLALSPIPLLFQAWPTSRQAVVVRQPSQETAA